MKIPIKTFPKNYNNNFEDQKMIKMLLILIISTILNIFIFFYVSFQTLIPTTGIIISFFIFSVIGFAFLKFKKVSQRILKSFTITPLILNVIFLINYIFRFNSSKESFMFQRNNQYVFNRFGSNISNQKNTEITLQDNLYEKYYGIRTFISEERIKGSKITYKFKTAIFRIKVMTNYEFN